ncbi:2OG-Fe(II) oxygenase family protein [Nostoc sp.]|uniref:2OG-Fe(II) oxygenase family protein n=1 Tax=Nostoc sp. TaxID=1180 RepID=UPI003FA5B5B0
MLYFHEKWSNNWGGSLRILKEDQPESTFYEVLPVIDSSIAFVPSANSWHTITPILPEAADYRLSLQVCFWKLSL